MAVALVLVFLAVLVPSAVILVVVFFAFLRTDDYELVRRRREEGLCVTCGYDLRESKETCPECGTPVPTESDAAGG